MTTRDYAEAYEDDSENVRGWPAQDKLEPYLLTAVCCREWPVDPLSPIGYCGFCGERPIIRPPWGFGRAPSVTLSEAEAATRGWLYSE